LSELDFNTEPGSERITLFAEIIIPVRVPRLFTYRVPFDFNDKVAIGKRVIVQFGRQKILTGVIARLHESPPKKYEAKYILDILDEKPSILPTQLQLFEWCAGYYMSTQGDVLNAAIPSGLKLSSQSLVQLKPGFDPEESGYPLDEKEEIIYSALKNQSLLSYQDIIDLLKIKNVYGVIKSMVTKGIILVIEQIKDKYKPKNITKIRLKPWLCNQKELESVFKTLEKKPKQTDLLLAYLRDVPVYNQPEKNHEGLSKSLFLKQGLSASALKTLIKNEIIEEFQHTVSRLDNFYQSDLEEIQLSELQVNTLNDIITGFSSQDVVLLHGITGSGKTEIYIQLIQNAIESGGQVLYMLPEIALTTQIVKRLVKVFGNKLGIYHSKYSDNERVEVWQNLLSEQYSVIVGVRSSVFLPFKNLSLLIVDEEHETSFKQFDHSFRYHARDCAIVLAKIHHAKTLLGSATPSFESYQNAYDGKYGHVSLNKRFGEALLPEIRIANLLDERKKKTIRGDFTSTLLLEMEKAFGNTKQSIIFQNRRGYSPFLSCDECAYVPKCENCSVSLTYHMLGNVLKCHYCGYKEPAPRYCVSCGSHRIRSVGFGTEKLEEDIRLLMPAAKVERMDLDTTRSKYGYQQLIDGFEKGEIDILVGTQMVTKGLDFDHVHLVGIVDLDRLLHFPDFRAAERSFQLVTQVSGRAGRRVNRGLVIIQTTDPTQPIIRHLTDQDFPKFYHEEIKERLKYRYPPFFRLIKVILRDKDQHIVQKAAELIAKKFREELNHRVLGPKEAMITRIRNKYYMEILIKAEKSNINLPSLKEFVRDSVWLVLNDREFKSVNVIFDVDPF